MSPTADLKGQSSRCPGSERVLRVGCVGDRAAEGGVSPATLKSEGLWSHYLKLWVALRREISGSFVPSVGPEAPKRHKCSNRNIEEDLSGWDPATGGQIVLISYLVTWRVLRRHSCGPVSFQQERALNREHLSISR